MTAPKAGPTPGPWDVEPGHKGFIVTARGGQYDIAVVRDIGNESNEANARLIAASPDLLEALREVEAHHVEQNRLKGRDESRSTTLRIVRAALAKAVQP